MALTAWPCACSGERYCAVPMIEPVSVMSEAPARAIPKSVTLTWPDVVDDHVVGLEVAMDDPVAMGAADGLEDLDGDVDRPQRIERRLLADDLLEGAPRQVLHGDVVRVLEGATVVDADDARMLQAGGGLGLAAEALHEVGVLRRSGGAAA